MDFFSETSLSQIENNNTNLTNGNFEIHSSKITAPQAIPYSVLDYPRILDCTTTYKVSRNTNVQAIYGIGGRLV